MRFLGVGTRGYRWDDQRPVPVNTAGEQDTAPGVYGIDPPDADDQHDTTERRTA